MSEDQYSRCGFRAVEDELHGPILTKSAIRVVIMRSMKETMLAVAIAIVVGPTVYAQIGGDLFEIPTAERSVVVAVKSGSKQFREPVSRKILELVEGDEWRAIRTRSLGEEEE